MRSSLLISLLLLPFSTFALPVSAPEALTEKSVVEEGILEIRGVGGVPGKSAVLSKGNKLQVGKSGVKAGGAPKAAKLQIGKVNNKPPPVEVDPKMPFNRPAPVPGWRANPQN